MTNDNTLATEVVDSDVSPNWSMTFGTSNRDKNAKNPILTFSIFYSKSPIRPVVSFTAPNNALFYETFIGSKAQGRRFDIYRGGTTNLTAVNNAFVAVSANSLATINTGDGGDIVFAGQTNSRLNVSLGAGNDLGIGSQLDDTLRGDDGADCLAGLGGNDKLYGGNGDDTLYGGDGNDSIYGGKGDDYLYSGKGNDHLRGDEGSDIFVFEEQNYQERGLRNLVTIEDFGRGNDLIDLRSFKFQSTGEMVTDKRFRLINDDGIARLAINNVGTSKDAYELSILVNGMSYEKFVSGRDSYMKYLIV